MPVVTISFGAGLAFVILGLLERQNDPLRDPVPIFLLNAAQNQWQPCRPIFFRRARVLLRNCQVVGRRKFAARKLFDNLLRNFSVGSLRIFFSHRLRAAKQVGNGRDCFSVSHSVLLNGRIRISYTRAMGSTTAALRRSAIFTAQAPPTKKD